MKVAASLKFKNWSKAPENDQFLMSILNDLESNVMKINSECEKETNGSRSENSPNKLGIQTAEVWMIWTSIIINYYVDDDNWWLYNFKVAI